MCWDCKLMFSSPKTIAMIGHDTLWDRLILHRDEPSRFPQLLNLFSSIKNSPEHVSSFNSKLFLSAILSHKNLPVTVTKLLSNVWLRIHGFAKALDIELSEYLHTIQHFEMEVQFETEMMNLPDLAYNSVLELIIESITSNMNFIALFPHVFKVDFVKCQLGKSWGRVMKKCWEHLTKNIHLLSVETIDVLVRIAFDIAYLVAYKGTGVLLRSCKGYCKIRSSIKQLNSPSIRQIPPCDNVLQELHDQKKLTCCIFESISNVSSHFEHLKPLYHESRLFLDSLAVHATCSNNPRNIVKLFSLAKFVSSDQLSRALFDSGHISYLEDIMASISPEHVDFVMKTALYRTLNFDPQIATWDELFFRVKEGLSMSKESFQKLMESFSLTEDTMNECCTVLHNLSPPDIALFLVKILSSGTHQVTIECKVAAIGDVLQTLQGLSVVDIFSFCKFLYNEQGLSVNELQQISDKERHAILGDSSNVTKTINQLGSKGSAKWKDSLHHTLMMNFVLFPDRILQTLVSQAVSNKALSLPVAAFLKDFLPFTLRALSSVSEFFFSSLKSEFAKLSSVKEVKLFDTFISYLKPALDHQTIVKLILLPYMKNTKGRYHTTLTLLQLYFNREPFYNFSLFYEMVRVWASADLDMASTEILDDQGILDAMAEKIKLYPKETDMMLQLITQGWGWKAGLRLTPLLESNKVKIGKNVSHLDLSVHISMTSVTFIDKDFVDDTGKKTPSLARSILHLAKYSSKIPQLETDSLISEQFATDLFTEFNTLTIKSARELKNVCTFVGHILRHPNFPDMIKFSETSSTFGTSVKNLATILSSLGLSCSDYINNDVFTLVIVSVMSGKSDKARWLGRLCDGTSFSQSLTQCFVLLAVVLDTTRLPHLETLLLSLTGPLKSGGGMQDDVRRVVSILPDSIAGTITSKSNRETIPKIGA